MSNRTERARIAGRLPVDDRPGEDLVRRFTRGLLVVVLVARWLVPTEGTAEGETLWIAQLSLLLGVVWTWSLLRAEVPTVRWGWFDAACGLFVGWQVVAAVAVFWRGGDARAAVNMAWEWVAVLMTYVVARQVIDSRAVAGRFVRLLMAGAIAISMLGLWQHFVGFPQLAREYVAEREEIDRLTNAAAWRMNDQSKRLAELRASFTSQGVPLEGPQRLAFENRLLGSREPLGRFSLANTLAGWLLAGVFALAGSSFVAMTGERRSWVSIAVPIAGLVVVLYCLLLTKSRTAFVGLIVGAAGWAISRGFADRRTGRAVLRWVAGAVLILGVGVGIAVTAGGLDREVLSQAPRSLRFRLQYWVATGDVIAERPWLGTGPGNFRQHYQRHKRPEASEDIGDPHNLVLDPWANAGTPAMLALLLAIGLGTWRCTRPPVPDDGTEPPAERSSLFDETTAGIAVAVLGLGGSALLFGGSNWQLLGTGLGWLALFVLFSAVVPESRSNAAARCGVGLDWGACAMLVHLLGAGGIAMPAVVSTLLLLFVLIDVTRLSRPEVVPNETSIAAPKSAKWPVTWRTATGLGLLTGVLFVTALLTATLPVLQSRLLRDSAVAASIDGRTLAAGELFASAAERDVLAPDPAEVAARFAFEDWLREPQGGEATYRRAVTWQQEAIRRDPYSASRRWTLAEIEQARFRKTGDSEAAEASLAALANAVERDPTNAALRANRALLLGEAGWLTEAGREAAIAVELDDVNRSEGHTDRLLPEETRRGLIPLRDGGA